MVRQAQARKRIMRHWQLYLLVFLPLLYYLVFHYYPMYGVSLAFKDFSFRAGIMGSPWAGLKYFRQILDTPNMARYLSNTVLISLYSLFWGFPLPILLAVALNDLKNQLFKKTVQMVSYAPYFISTVVMVGMLMQLFSLRGGLVNSLTGLLGLEPVNYMGEPRFFRSMYIGSGIWQGVGYASILYIAALSTVDPTLYEAADIDGANKFRKVWHIDLPTILPTIVITLILSTGNLLNVGFEKTFLMQNPLNLSISEIIPTFVYKAGLLNTQYSFSTAVSLLNSIANFSILILVNRIANRLSGTSLW